MSQAQFDKAAQIVTTLPSDGPVKPSDDDSLYLYARFKQVTVGDVNTARPSVFSLRERYKWDAWDKIKGMSKEQAMKEYVEKLIELLKQAGDADSQARIDEIEKA
ncbi:acyl-CoA-binding protein (ACBP)/diazepam binding inhibitor (DBI)/endozepine (EP) [Leucoagaricus gongylophorus]